MTDHTLTFTRPRHDETLYSALARASVYLGSPQPSLLHAAITAQTFAIYDDLPVGMGSLMSSGVMGSADLDGAIHEWTLYPYYAHYGLPNRARAAMAQMATTGIWPHAVLQRGTQSPEYLRFCPSCRAEMLEQYSDLWWQRTHQLPSSYVCPDHAELLRVSTVSREQRCASYVPASELVCPIDAPTAISSDHHVSISDLLWIARAGDHLLDRRCDQHPDDRREGYLRRLLNVRMLNKAGEAKLSAIAAAMDSRWGSLLSLWPELSNNGRCSQSWLGALLMGEHGSPVLHHLLLEGMLEFHERWR